MFVTSKFIFESCKNYYWYSSTLFYQRWKCIIFNSICFIKIETYSFVCRLKSLVIIYTLSLKLIFHYFEISSRRSWHETQQIMSSNRYQQRKIDRIWFANIVSESRSLQLLSICDLIFFTSTLTWKLRIDFKRLNEQPLVDVNIEITVLMTIRTILRWQN